MATIIGYVSKMNGDFQVINGDEEYRELFEGSPIYEGDKVLGDSSAKDFIVISKENDGGDIKLAGNEPLLFDASLTDQAFEAEEVAFVEDEFTDALADITPEEVPTNVEENFNPEALVLAKSTVAEVQETKPQRVEVPKETISDSEFIARTADETNPEKTAVGDNASSVSQSFDDLDQTIQRSNPLNVESIVLEPVKIVNVISDVEPDKPSFAGSEVTTIATPLLGESTTISLSGNTSVVEGGSAIYTLTLDKTPVNDLDVTLNISHISTDNGDLVSQSISVTIPSGTTVTSFNVANIDDVYAENAELYNVSIVKTSGGGFSEVVVVSPDVQTTITDVLNGVNGLGPVITLTGDLSIEEGSSGAYKLTIDTPPASDMTIKMLVGHTTTVDGDIVDLTQDVVIKKGTTAADFKVQTQGDDSYEGVETFKLSVASTTGGGYEITPIIPSALSVGIYDAGDAPLGDGDDVDVPGQPLVDDDRPRFSVGDVSISEGGLMTFTVSRVGDSASQQTVDFKTGLEATDTAEIADFTATNGTLTFNTGVTSQTFTVQTTQDTPFEGAETFSVTLLNNSTGSFIEDAKAVGTILDDGTGAGPFNPGPSADDDRPGFSVGDVNISEGGLMTFTVSRVGDATKVQTVDFATKIKATDSAEATDFIASSGTLNFNAGVSSQTFTVQTTQDTPFEGGETFSVLLSNNSAGSLIADGEAVGTILDDGTGAGPFNPGPNADDDRPSFSVGDVNISEGGLMTFTVTRLGDAKQTQQIDFATSIKGSDTAEVNDFTANSGTLTFNEGVSSQTFTVQTTQDTPYEGGETFSVTLSNNSQGSTISDAIAVGTILDDGTGAGPFNPGPNADDDRIGFSVNDVSISEGGLMTFTVTRAGDAVVQQTVDFTTGLQGTDTAELADFTTTTGTVTFNSGVVSQTFTVQTTQDTVYELSETFSVTLSNNSAGSLIVDGVGIGTIKDDGTGAGPFNPGPNADDDKPLISIAPTAAGSSDVVEAHHALFTLTRTGATEIAGSVAVSVVNGTALKPTDNTDFSGVLEYEDSLGNWKDATNGVPMDVGTATVNLRVNTTLDGVDEGTENFSVNITGASQLVVDNANSSASGTISDKAQSLFNDNVTVEEKAMSTGSQSTLTTEIATGNVFANDVKSDIPSDGKITKITIDGVDTVVIGALTSITTQEGNTLLVNTDASSVNFGNFTYTLNNKVNHITTLVNETYSGAYDGSWGSEANSDGVAVGIQNINGNQMLRVPQQDVVSSGDIGHVSTNSAHKAFDLGSKNANIGVNVALDIDLTKSGFENDGSEYFDVYINNQLVEHYQYTGTKILHKEYAVTADSNGGIDVKFVSLGNSGGGTESIYVDNLTISTVDNIIDDVFTYTVEGTGFSKSADINVSIVDDTPHIQNTAESIVVGSAVDTNLLLVIDRSSSMEEVINGKNYMEWMTESLQNMIQKYDSLGNVNVKIVGFWAGTDANGDSVTEQVNAYDKDGSSYTDWISATDALKYLSYDPTLSKQENSAAGQIFYYTGTWFDNGINTSISQFDKTQADSFNADQTIAYFLSDGSPTSGHKGDTVAWNNFIDANADSSVAIMFGEGTSSTSANKIMNELANPGDAIIVGNVDDLNPILVDSVFDVQGSVEGMSGTSDIIFGADDGHIQSIDVNGKTYLYDSSKVDQRIDLTYGKIDINFNTGAYTYKPSVHTNATEKLTINIVDNDADISSAVLTLNITHNATNPTAVNQVVAMTPNSTVVLGIDSFGYHDTDGDKLASIKITNVVQIDTGRLLFNGVDVFANQVITKADLEAGKLIFKTEGTTALNYDSFKFVVSDGTTFSTIEKTFTYNVGKTLSVSSPGAVYEGESAEFTIALSSSRTSNTKVILNVAGNVTSIDDYVDRPQFESAPGVWTDVQTTLNTNGTVINYFVIIDANKTSVNVRVNTVIEASDNNDGGETLYLNANIAQNESGNIGDMANLQHAGKAIVNENITRIEFDATKFNAGDAGDAATFGEDVLIFKSSGENIDFSALGNDKITNVETINLNYDANGLNGSHTLSNISLADVVALTDSNNELKILGDNGDSVSIKNSDWNAGAVGTGVDVGLTVYTGSDNSTILKIDQDINTSII